MPTENCELLAENSQLQTPDLIYLFLGIYTRIILYSLAITINLFNAMKKISLFILLLSSVYIADAQNQSFFNTSLEAVTVYRTGAELNHTAKVDLPMGTFEIVLGNVSNNVDQNSVQISTPINVTVLSITFVKDYLKNENKNPAYLRLEDSLTFAKKELNTIQNKKIVDENLLGLLDKNQVVGGASGFNVAELMKMTDYYKTKQLELRTSVYNYQVLEQKQQAKVNKLQNQLNELGANLNGSKGQLVLQVSSSAAVNGAVFAFSYLTSNASWTPFYDLRGESIATPLKIVYKANVVQNTGIDWKKVKLSLSTGIPTQNGTAPLLSAWFLRFGSPDDYSRNVAYQNTVGRVESRAPMAAAQAGGANANDQNLATQSSNSLNTSFDIDIPYDVASNNKPHSVTLNTYNQPVNYKYYCVPKLDKDVFLLAEITGYEKLNLLPGEANMIFENTYVGKSVINPNATTDTLNLSMGRDKNIVVKREKVVEQNVAKTIGNSKKQTFTYEITLRNNKKDAINLLLKDQYPVTTDKTIEVELITASGATANAETGVLTWKLTLEPGVTQKIRISYSVKYPKDQSIANL
jgi:uncharacterized protein (TIGR02231 family)